jgi:hypothetical protein
LTIGLGALTVSALVSLACGFALVDAFRRATQLKRLAELEPKTSPTERASSARRPLLADDARLVALAREAEAEQSERPRRAIVNQLTLELEGRLSRFADTAKMNWRICVASGVAGGLLQGWESPVLACSTMAFAATAAILCAGWARVSATNARRARGNWRAFMTGLLSRALFQSR